MAIHCGPASRDNSGGVRACGKAWGRPSRSGDFDGLTRVDQVAQFLRRCEVGHAFGRDIHTLAGFGIASSAGVALADAEGPEAANFDFISALQSSDHRVKNGLDDDLAVAACQIAP